MRRSNQNQNHPGRLFSGGGGGILIMLRKSVKAMALSALVVAVVFVWVDSSLCLSCYKKLKVL